MDRGVYGRCTELYQKVKQGVSSKPVAAAVLPSSKKKRKTQQNAIEEMRGLACSVF